MRIAGRWRGVFATQNPENQKIVDYCRKLGYHLSVRRANLRGLSGWNRDNAI